jgi:hypothetical protein
MNPILSKLISSVHFQMEQLKFDFKWMTDQSEIYTDLEISFLKGRICGLGETLKLINELNESLIVQEKMNNSFRKIHSLLDELNVVIDKRND